MLFPNRFRRALALGFRAQIRNFSTPRPVATSIAPLPPLPPPSYGTRDGSNSKSGSPPPGPPVGDTDGRPLTRIPTRHSRKRLPAVIIDTQQLQSLSERILEAPIGSLYSFDTTISPHDNPDPWDAADSTVQTVEAILRGLAARVPGTCWQRWTARKKEASGDDVDALEVALAMQDLMGRLHEEGLAYMNVRADRMDELDAAAEPMEQNKLLDGTGSSNRVQEDVPALHHGQPKHSLESSVSNKHLVPGDKDKDDADQQTKRKHLHDFALPGPTVTMIDSILDVLACGAPHVSVTARVMKMFQDADFLLHLAHARYELDGGDTHHTNPYTRPTILTFNACIRLAAQVTNEEYKNEHIRDGAITLAFSTFQATDECAVVDRNSASYVYLMHVIAQTMPASRMRGNIARGVFEQARYRCLVNDALIEAYRQANAPSNCPTDDAFLLDTLASNENVPVKWRRESKRRRYHVREDTY